MEFIQYSKCTTCQKAKKYLDEKGIDYEDRPIKEKVPSVKEIEEWVKKCEIPINKLFNTSGLLYRSMNLKDKLSSMSDEEKIRLLASDGMLIKRPLLVSDDKVLVGFKVKEWDECLK